MYHLLVTAKEGAWDGSPYVFPRVRVLREYLDDALKAKYQDLDEDVMAELLSFPAIFAYEEYEDADARIGFIRRIRKRVNEVRIEYDVISDLPPIPAQVLSKLSWELEIDGSEMNRTHWAIKPADLFQVLIDSELISNEQLLSLTTKLKGSSIGDEPGMTPEERRNSGLILLLQLAQVYYTMLECTISLSDWCTALDMELNESYFWTVNNIKAILNNLEDLNDFPVQFEPLFPDLYPSTIRDTEWEYVATEAERFLSTVQKYVASKGAYEPEVGTAAWVFLELFKPNINAAIDRAKAYKKNMEEFIRTKLGPSRPTPRSDSANIDSPTADNPMKSPSPTRDKVFISYSHKDKKFLDELLAHLKPLERAGRVSAWSDQQIKPGSEWAEQIQVALDSAKVAVLLVTKDFLASDFIDQNELGPLLVAARESGVAIRWVLVRDCNWKKTPLNDYQAAYPPDKPLAGKNWSRDSAWVAICDAIEEAANMTITT